MLDPNRTIDRKNGFLLLGSICPISIDYPTWTMGILAASITKGKSRVTIMEPEVSW